MTGRKDPTHQAFETLIRYLYFLYADWYVLTELFGRSRERVELLNRRAGAVFFFIQDAMQDRLFLGIAKLFDEDSRTLSLRNCIADLPDAPARSAKAVRKEYHERRKRFLDRYEALKKLCEPTLHHRDRRIVDTCTQTAWSRRRDDRPDPAR